MVSLVIVGHQTKDLLEACLRSVYEMRPSVPFEVCVVDNASTDGTPEMVRGKFPEVQLVENQRNVGYSTAVNEGFRRTTAPYVLVINPDIVVTEGAIDALVRYMEATPEAGVVGGRLLNPDGSLQYSARTFYTLRVLLMRRTPLGRLFPNSRAIRDHLMLDWDHNDVREVDWLMGACLMIRRSAAENVGLMDERYFLYFEDVDLCYKMRQRGWKVVYLPEAEMVHHHRRASARRMINRPFFYHLNSVFHFYDKWGGFFQSVKRHRKLVQALTFLLSDMISINLAFFVAYFARLLLGPILVKPLFGVGAYLDLLVFINVTTLLAFAALGLYRARPVGSVDEVLAVAKGASVSFVILMAGTFVSQTQFYSRTLVAMFWPCVIVLASLGRILNLRLHSELRGFQFDLQRAVVVGGGIRAMEVQQNLRENPRLGCELVGMLSPEDAAADFVPLLGRPEDLERVVEEMGIQQVIFADAGVSNETVADFLLKSGKYGVDVRVMTDLEEVLTRTGRVEEFLGVPVAVFERGPLFGLNAAIKRGLDVLGAVVGLVVTWPVAAVTSVFRLLRADPGRSEAWDDRLRRGVGGLWNVLVGRMSFVGPRPADRSRASQLRGHSVARQARPGLTGPCAAARILVGEREKEILEVFYERNWSLALDLRILLASLRRAHGGVERVERSEIGKG